MSEETHFRTCHLCEAMCGIEITVDDGRVSRIRPNPDDVWSQGYICPKGTTLGDLHHDPDRLRRPTGTTRRRQRICRGLLVGGV